MSVGVAAHHQRLLLRRLLLELEQILLVIRAWHVVVLALVLGEQLEPAVGGVLDDLRDAKGQGAHEVVARGAVPVPYLDQDASILVLGLKVTRRRFKGIRIILKPSNIRY